MTTGLDQLAALMAQIVQRQEERQQRDEEYRRDRSDARKNASNGTKSIVDNRSDSRKNASSGTREYRQQQDAKHQEQLMAMQEQLQALRERRPTTNSHLSMTPFQESVDIQEFLETFEGIMV